MSSWLLLKKCYKSSIIKHLVQSSDSETWAKILLQCAEFDELSVWLRSLRKQWDLHTSLALMALVYRFLLQRVEQLRWLDDCNIDISKAIKIVFSLVVGKSGEDE